jgi:hypothetical protein
MSSLHSALNQLQQERDSAQKHLDGLNAAIAVITRMAGSSAVATPSAAKSGKSGKRILSAAARAKIAAAQRARWARTKGTAAPAAAATAPAKAPVKRILSPAARRKIAAAQKARWAKYRAAKA